MTDLATLLSHVDGARLRDLLVELVNHYSPSYAEGPVTAAIAAHFERQSIPFRLQHVPATPEDTDRANLIVELGPMPPALLLVGHVDTIPYWGDEDEEHAAIVEGDVVHGLGTADMKSGCAAMIEAIGAIVRAGVPLKRGICLALVVGEEEYGDGTEALLSEVLAPVAVIGEPTNLVPCTEHFAYLEGRLTSTGLRAHAALPDVGANAIHAMLTWLLQIYEHAARLSPPTRVAFNPREIIGGGSLFVVAERCEASLDVHLSPDIDRDQVETLIEQARRVALESHHDCNLGYESVYWAPGYAIEDRRGVLKPLRRACDDLGLPWEPAAFPSHSDGNLFFQRGILPVIWGPGDLQFAHTRDEHVHLSQVEQAARLYAAMIYEACAR